MKKAIAEKWVKALRSKKYKQAKGALALGKGYCCLGVLCEIAIKEGLPLQKQQAISKGAYYYDGECRILPPKVSKWASLKTDNPMVKYDDDRFPLAELNDYKLSFKKIADLIEAQWRSI